MADQESPLMMDESDRTVVTCWACNILVAAPLGTDGLAAPVFKCGWCGAVNDLQQRVEDKEAALANGYQPHCVVDMDHHCPFINNCVGRGNLRPFLLFLLWTILAAAYVLAMCSALVWREWDVYGKWQVLWGRLQDVLGVDGSSGFAFSTALLVPQWQPTASAGVSTAVKKWS
ncbi:hypothetical protein OEZ86_001638 [Tetradesmus obliquus]|nr:hypothetical protein OEZ86_001638 [Tetradesmus obliquus]